MRNVIKNVVLDRVSIKTQNMNMRIHVYKMCREFQKYEEYEYPFMNIKIHAYINIMRI